jgi:hypothetical protein
LSVAEWIPAVNCWNLEPPDFKAAPIVPARSLNEKAATRRLLALGTAEDVAAVAKLKETEVPPGIAWKTQVGLLRRICRHYGYPLHT